MRRPALPGGRRLPWILVVVSVALVAYGLGAGSDTLVLMGVLGVAATVVGFILPRLLLPTPDESESNRREDGS